MLFSAALRPYSSLGNAFTISLQSHSTHISNWHILPILIQSSPAYKLIQGLYSLHFSYIYRLLLASKALLMWVRKDKHTYIHAYK